MAITLYSLTSGTANASSGTTASIVSTGNRLQLMSVHGAFSSSPGASQTLSITDSETTWALVNTQGTYIDATNYWLFSYLYRAMPASTTASRTISITSAGNTFAELSWSIEEFDSVDTTGTYGSGAIVQSAVAQVSFGGTLSITATLAAFGSTNNATFGMVGGGYYSAVTYTEGSGFTRGNFQHSTNYTSILTEFKNTNDTTVDFSINNSQHLAAIAVEIKYAAAAVAPSYWNKQSLFRPGKRGNPLTSFKQTVQGATPATATSIVFRKTLSSIGTKSGSRQTHNT
jgi:hypothetical protein